MNAFALASACLLAWYAAGAAETVEWTYDLGAPAGAPTLYPDAEHPTGVIVTSSNNVIRLDGKGAALWVSEQPASVATPATVADIDDDGAAEAVFSLETGDVVCLDTDGQTRWTSSLGRGIVGSFKMVTAADVLPEPGLEVLAGSENGWLRCLSARGELLWRFYGDEYHVSPVAVGDMDRDGAPELVYGTDDGHIYCLSGAGRVKWRYWEMAPYGRSGPNLADLDGDGAIELLVTRSNVGNATCLMALDAASGEYLWRTKDVMQGYVSNATADLDGDGTLETLHTDKGNWVYCVNADGSERWRTELGGHGIFWTPVVGDIDGDGQFEVVAGSRGADPVDNACVFILGQDGSLLARLKLGSSANSGMAMGDIDGDGELEVVIPTEGPNRVQVLTWHGRGRVAWPSLRGNSAMTAAANAPPGTPAVPVADAATGTVNVASETAYLGENQWEIAWDAPAPEEACLEIAATPEDGPCETRIVPVKAGAKDVTADWAITEAGPHSVLLRLAASNQPSPLFVAQRRVVPEPASYCALAGVEQACASAVESGAATGADTGLIAAWLGALKTDRDRIQSAEDAGEIGAALAERATALRRAAKQLQTFASASAAFWRAGGSGSFVAWQDENPWDAFDPLAVPAAFPQEASVRVAAYGDEYEDVALTLLNVTPDPIDVRCMFAPPSFGQGPAQSEPGLAKHVILRRAVRVPSMFGTMVNDALPELDASRTLTLTPGHACQLWLVVDTHGLDPGTHELTLYLGSLEQRPTVREIAVSVEVWPVQLPEGVYAKMNWAPIDAGVVSDQQLEDMIAHGNSVSYGPTLPKVPVDDRGAPAGGVDWTHVDATLARVPGYWQVLFGGPPPLHWPEGIAPEPKSPLWEEGFKTGVRVLAEHLRSVGWGYDRWAFYPIDEPWNTGETVIPELRWFCKLVKAADPNARNYADPAGNVDAEKVAEFKDLIDVWQPEINHLKRDPKLLAWFQENARAFWAYEATSPGKNLLPLGYYRGYGWLAWLFGLDGAGYWCYKYGDLWQPLTSDDWSVVYQTNDLVVPSRRWEASRDGVEDYRALYALAQEIAKARQDGRGADADRAQALMDEAVQRVAGWQVAAIDEITRRTRDYEIDFALLSDYRARIMQEIAALRGGTASQ